MARGGGFTFADSNEFNAVMDNLYSDRDSLRAAGQAAGKYIKDSIGASDIIYSDIFGKQSNYKQTT